MRLNTFKKKEIMDVTEKLDKKDVKELFSKNWLTHDAMWFVNCMQELGPEKANKINKSAVRMMAPIEMARILKLMGKPKGFVAKTYDDVREVITAGFNTVQTDFMKFDFSFPEPNVLRGNYSECFAHEGLKMYDMIDKYDCGIVDRVLGWLDCVNVSHEVKPDFKGCLMHMHGKCEVDVKFEIK